MTDPPTATEAARARRDLVVKLGMAHVAFGNAMKQSAVGDLALPEVRRLLPAGLVGSIGGELLATIGYLALGRWAYGAAALVRQLVEIEYLSWAVTNDPDDAWEWFSAPPHTRLARWQPGRIRQRSEGRFPNSDYHDHCEAGGHPVPRPAMAILDHRDLWVETSLYEAALHGSASWHYLLRSLADIPPVEEIEEQHRIVDEAYAAWRATDRLGSVLRDSTES